MLSMPLLGQFKEISHFSISKKNQKLTSGTPRLAFSGE
jgi:hypothetical protein